MQLSNGAARNLNSFDKETGDQDARVDLGKCARGRLYEVRGGNGSADEIVERKDIHKVLNGSVIDCSNGEEVEEVGKEVVVDVEVDEDGSFSEGDSSFEEEDSPNAADVRDNQLDIDSLPLPDEGQVSEQAHADSEWHIPSSSNQANLTGSQVTVFKSSNPMTGVEMARGFSNCHKCNGTGQFPVVATGDNVETEMSSPIVEDDNGLTLEEGSKPRPVDQRCPNVSEISWGMWLKCFLKFFLGSLMGDLITTNPLLTIFNVILLPISFALCLLGDALFFVVSIFYELVFMSVYIFLYILWVLNGVVAICWHFLQLSSFSTRLAKIIFEFLWDMRAAFKDDEHFRKLSSR